jgi:glycerol kinase
LPDYIASIDQGTTSTRCIVFDHNGRMLSSHQQEHRQILPRPGWVEHDPEEIWRSTQEVLQGAISKGCIEESQIAAIGVTNQRETAVVWDRHTGRPVYNAIVWQDTRTEDICKKLAEHGGRDRFRAATGLPLATYFSGPKFRWILDNVEGARRGAERGDVLFGTVDSYLLWWLTGGPDGGIHVTDVTNASRTLLLDLEPLDWSDDILEAMSLPRAALPEIRSSAETYGHVRNGLKGVPIASAVGDQQAALIGQACFRVGEAKNTYGTGAFLLLNTGDEIVRSRHGLLTTVAYQFSGHPPVFALEGSIAVAGSLVQWLRDNLGLIEASADVEALAQTVEDNGGVYFVPAFSGLFAPHWRSDARGLIAGLTRYANKGHIARAALEATAFQTREVVEAMEKDSGVRLTELRVDGGMAVNNTLMQFQADILGAPVIRPKITETTALGAAYAAGLAVGFWGSIEDVRRHARADRTWRPGISDEERDRLYRRWRAAVERSIGWEQQ